MLPWRRGAKVGIARTRLPAICPCRQPTAARMHAHFITVSHNGILTNDLVIMTHSSSRCESVARYRHRGVTRGRELTVNPAHNASTSVHSESFECKLSPDSGIPSLPLSDACMCDATHTALAFQHIPQLPSTSGSVRARVWGAWQHECAAPSTAFRSQHRKGPSTYIY